MSYIRIAVTSIEETVFVSVRVKKYVWKFRERSPVHARRCRWRTSRKSMVGGEEKHVARRTIESRRPAAARCGGGGRGEYCTRVNYCGETDAQKIKIQKGGRVGVAAVSSVGASRAGERT